MAATWAGCIHCDGALVDVPTARSAAAPAQVQLAASALNAAGLSAGERVLVALVQLPDDGGGNTAPNAAASPFSSRTASPSVGTPPQPPRTPTTGTKSQARPRLDVANDAAPLPFVRSSDSSVSSAADVPPGETLLVACVWPSEKLATDAASATAAVLDVAGCPPPGSVLRMYPLATSSSTAPGRVRALVAECEHLTLTLCEPVGTAQSGGAPDAAQPLLAPATPKPSHLSRAGSGSASKAATPGDSPARTPAVAASRTKSSAARCEVTCSQHFLLLRLR
jgi:hypothetical protein